MTSHGWHLPTYTLLFLGLFAHPGLKWSVDAWIKRRCPRYLFGTKPIGLASTGLARNLILISAVYILFAAGFSKISESGLEWVDGRSLGTYLHLISSPKFELGQWLFSGLQEHSSIRSLLSMATLLIELLSPLALLTIFNQRLRLGVFFGAAIMHTVIYLLMIPNYFAHMLCYFLCINWKTAIFKAKEEDETVSLQYIQLSSAICGALILALTFTLANKKEAYPFSDIPMYSTYFTPSRVNNFAYNDFVDLSFLRRVSNSYNNTKKPWMTKFILGHHMRIRIIQNGKERILNPKRDDFIGRGNPRFLSTRMATFLMHDLKNLPAPTPINELVHYKGMLHDFLANVILKKLGGESVELYYITNDEITLIASVVKQNDQ